MLELIAAADEAEARGDALGALEVVASQPWDEDGRLFWRPWRIVRLEQVVRLGDLLPRWAVSRWILEQAMQAHQPSLLSGRLQCLGHAVELRGGLAALPGVDEIDARSRVMDNDWVYRQLYLYDYGALAMFLRRSASGDLVAGADRIWDWANAPMRALRLVGRTDHVVRWVDLATDEQVEVPNLGGGALLLPGECALGRLVPTDLGDMFECTPLRVSGEVAGAVAEDPTSWLAALRSAPAKDCSSHATVRGSYMLSDVPPTAWQVAVLSYAGAEPEGVAAEVLADAVIATVRDAMTGLLDEESADAERVDLWPCIAAGMLHPVVMEGLPGAFGVDDAPRLLELSNRLVGPAADVCRALAEPLPDAA